MRSPRLESPSTARATCPSTFRASPTATRSGVSQQTQSQLPSRQPRPSRLTNHPFIQQVNSSLERSLGKSEQVIWQLGQDGS